MRIVWSPLATASVEAIRSRLAAYSSKSASDFVGSLDQRVRQLELFPESGRIVPEYGLPLLRELVEAPYRIVYEVFPDRVEIVIVRHGREQLYKSQTKEPSHRERLLVRCAEPVQVS